MNCSEIENLIHPYIDGELDLMRSLEVEQHLARCQTCAAAHARHLALRTAVRKHVPAIAPAGLRQQLLSTIRSEELPVAKPDRDIAPKRAESRPRWRIMPHIAWAAAACVAVSTMAGWLLLRQPSMPTMFAEEIVSDHIRSLQVEHLTDVPSSDQHTVKPWFNGKLDFSPHVQDLADVGFPLIGGRLDYLDRRPVAALVYRRNKHFINVFVWPADGATQDSSPVRQDIRGYHIVHFDQGGLTYCAVSDVDPAELNRLAMLIRQPSTNPSSEEPR